MTASDHLKQATGSLGEDQRIKHMVDRFLQWKLPENFNPDGGISFKPMRNENSPWPAKNEPVGTNLLDATQAEEMVRFMLEGLGGDQDEKALLALRSHKWTGRQMGGNPTNAESYEWVRFCDYCGAEDTCKDDTPACEVTRESLHQELKQAESALAQKTRECEEAKRVRFEREQGRTHWDGCWREHYTCAMAQVEQLGRQVAEMTAVLNEVKEEECSCDMSQERLIRPALPVRQLSYCSHLAHAPSEEEGNGKL